MTGKPRPLLEAEVTELRDQLAQLRARLGGDVEDLQALLLARNRRIRELESQLKAEEESGVAEDEVHWLLKLWWERVKSSNPRVDWEHPKRRRAVAKAVRRYGADAVMEAVLGCLEDAWAMGRKAGQQRARNDIADDICERPANFEAFRELYVQRELRARAGPPTGVNGTGLAQADGADTWAKAAPPDANVTDAATPDATFDQAQVSVRTANKPFSRKMAPTYQWGTPAAWAGVEDPLSRVLGALWARGCTVEAYDGKPDAYSAQCPAHDDHDPSLSIHRGREDTVLVYCWAGCPTESVLAALGLDWRDLWDRAYDEATSRDRRPPPPHIAEAARALQRTLSQWDRSV
jgi:hypothetical protein